MGPISANKMAFLCFPKIKSDATQKWDNKFGDLRKKLVFFNLRPFRSKRERKICVRVFDIELIRITSEYGRNRFRDFDEFSSRPANNALLERSGKFDVAF